MIWYLRLRIEAKGVLFGQNFLAEYRIPWPGSGHGISQTVESFRLSRHANVFSLQDLLVDTSS